MGARCRSAQEIKAHFKEALNLVPVDVTLGYNNSEEIEQYQVWDSRDGINTATLPHGCG